MTDDIKDLLIEQRELMLAIARKQQVQEQALLRIARNLLLHTQAGSYSKKDMEYILYGENTNDNN